MPNRSVIQPRLAAVALAGSGWIHAVLVPQHLRVSYLGLMFVAAAAASGIIALKLWRTPAEWPAWLAGALVAGGMALGLLLSRTIGLPAALGFAAVREQGVWGPAETVSLFLELAFLALACLETPWRRAAAGVSARAPGPAASAAGAERAGISRRRALAALAPLVGTGMASRLVGGPSFGLSAASAAAAGHQGGAATGANDGQGPMTHGNPGVVGRVDPRANGFDPATIVRDFDWGRTRRLASGELLREWELVAEDKQIEVAPGVKYDAWTYNGRVPGPTLRAREGDLLRVRFTNGGSVPHTIHFHGIHTDINDGVPGIGPGVIEPGKSFTYEFVAEPFGFHHYHCHVMPLSEHIAKGLYGAFVVDPKDGRPEADELVLVQNGFDINFDRQNEVYAVNTVAFAYMEEPIRVRRGELVRIYLLNILEFDPMNSFHIHANFFQRFPTGTSLEPSELTDILIQGQGQRDILELRFPYTGKYMFHAHKSEFAELGWMGFFEVVD